MIICFGYYGKDVRLMLGVTRWFEQKSTQYLSKNVQLGAQSKNTKNGEKLY